MILNNNSDFNSHEEHIARVEMNSRVRKAAQAALQSSTLSNDPTAFSKNLIAQYQSISSEERAAAGFTQEYYDALVKNHETSSTILQALSGVSNSSGSSASGGVLSLLNYL